MAVSYLPAVGEAEIPQYLGTYPAIVANNNDPLGVGRLQLLVPMVLGPSVSSWAVPAGSYFSIPANNTTVSCVFLGGDPSQPAWNGPLDLSPIVEAAAPPTVTYAASAPADPRVKDVWYEVFTDANSNRIVSAPQVWTFDPVHSTFSWVVQASANSDNTSPGGTGSAALGANVVSNDNIVANTITAASLAAGIIYAGIVDGTEIDGGVLRAKNTHGATIMTVNKSSGTWLLYNDTGSSTQGTLVSSGSQGSGTDEFGHAYLAGLVVYDGNGGYIEIFESSGVCKIRFNPAGAAHANVIPIIEAGSLNTGAANEIEVLQFVSGNATGRNPAEYVMLSDAADGSGIGVHHFQMGGTVIFGIDANGIVVNTGSITSTLGTTSNPTVITTDTLGGHTASLSNSWTGTLKYKLMPDNTVKLSGTLVVPSGVSNPSVITTLAGIYVPTNTQPVIAVENAGSPFLGGARVCEMLNTGALHVYDTTAGDTLRIMGNYSLDM